MFLCIIKFFHFLFRYFKWNLVLEVTNLSFHLEIINRIFDRVRTYNITNNLPKIFIKKLNYTTLRCIIS